MRDALEMILRTNLMGPIPEVRQNVLHGAIFGHSRVLPKAAGLVLNCWPLGGFWLAQ